MYMYIYIDLGKCLKRYGKYPRKNKGLTINNRDLVGFEGVWMETLRGIWAALGNGCWHWRYEKYPIESRGFIKNRCI